MRAERPAGRHPGRSGPLHQHRRRAGLAGPDRRAGPLLGQPRRRQPQVRQGRRHLQRRQDHLRGEPELAHLGCVRARHLLPRLRERGPRRPDRDRAGPHRPALPHARRLRVQGFRAG